MDEKRMAEIALAVLTYMMSESVISVEGIREGVDNLSGKTGISDEELLEFGGKVALKVLQAKEANVRELIKE